MRGIALTASSGVHQGYGKPDSHFIVGRSSVAGKVFITSIVMTSFSTNPPRSAKRQSYLPPPTRTRPSLFADIPTSHRQTKWRSCSEGRDKQNVKTFS